MSILGINPSRDKKAKLIIYGGGAAYFSLIKIIAAANINNPGVMIKIWSQTAKQRKEIKDKAWKLYCESGDIWNSLKPFIIDK